MAKSKSKAPLTTAQQLGSLIKTARDIMRKDKGLSSDLGRLPMLTWIMFLKFLDDMEQIEESRAELRGEKYRTSIDKPYRWRDWAAKEDGITGPELLAFINQEEAVLPNGKKGVGLFTYLRGLRAGNGNGGRRQVIATVFSGVANNMISGYLLRDVINKVNGIHFLAKEEMFTLGHLYESMLKEMRDAAGQNGEFYTPRAVVRFMVEVLDPRLGETVLDPACGTGGFLVEAFSHLEKQCKTVQDRKSRPGAEYLRRRSQAPAIPALPDEPAAARTGGAEDRSGEQPSLPAGADRRPRPGGRRHDEPALRRRRGAGDSLQLPG